MKRLRLGFDEIQKAMEDIVRDNFDYFLDCETGEVLTLSENIFEEIKLRLYEGDYDEIKEDVEYIEFDEGPDLTDWMEEEVEMALEILLDETGRYIRIPERESPEAFRIMAAFMETVKDPILKQELSIALNGKGAFRKFKDVLLDYPKERKRWHGYNAKAMKKVITEWLRSIGIEEE
ncbi:MAG: UPF0158 family protein [Nitrospirota bacterium]